MLSAVGSTEGIELLLNRLAKSESNAHFLATLTKQAAAES
jgi:transcription termination factor Rho